MLLGFRSESCTSRVIAGRAVGKQFGGPKLKDGNANDDVFVIVGVTLAMAVKASG